MHFGTGESIIRLIAAVNWQVYLSHSCENGLCSSKILCSAQWATTCNVWNPTCKSSSRSRALGTGGSGSICWQAVILGLNIFSVGKIACMLI